MKKRLTRKGFHNILEKKGLGIALGLTLGLTLGIGGAYFVNVDTAYASSNAAAKASYNRVIKSISKACKKGASHYKVSKKDIKNISSNNKYKKKALFTFASHTNEGMDIIQKGTSTAMFSSLLPEATAHYAYVDSDIIIAISDPSSYRKKYMIWYDYTGKQAKKLDKVAEKFKKATNGMSDYEKILYVYKWEALDNIKFSGDSVGNLEAYNVLIKKKYVCQGLADANGLIFSWLGIRSVPITGSGHAWNLVELDGKWYHFDAPWAKFLVSDKEVKKDSYVQEKTKGYPHKWSSHPYGIKCKANYRIPGNKLVYPVLDGNQTVTIKSTPSNGRAYEYEYIGVFDDEDDDEESDDNVLE